MMAPGTRRWLVIAGVLMLAFGVRLGAAFWWQSRLGAAHAFGFPDSEGYWTLGRAIAAGEPYEHGGADFRVFRAPGYPVFLASLFAVLGDEMPVMWARVAGAWLGTLTVGALIWLGRDLFDGRTGLLAGLMAAVDPGAIGMSVFVLGEALFCPLMVGQLACWVRAGREVPGRKHVWWALAAGVVGALATLARPSWLLFLPFVLGLLVLASRRRWRHLAVGSWMVLGFCIAMGPWWVRNYVVVGRFVPTTLQVGASLYDGLSPSATGESNMAFAEWHYRAQKRDDAAAGRSNEGFEVRLDRRLRDAAVAWAVEHPGAVVSLMGRKFCRMWNVWPNATEFRGWGLRVVMALGFVPFLALGLVGAWRWCRRGWPYVVCVLPAVYLTMLHVIFVSSIRYRQPAMLVWLVLSAAVVSAWLCRRGLRRTVAHDAC